MPALANIRHERFARYWMKTGSRTEAYRKAGFSTTNQGSIWTGAYRTFKNVQVQARIRELKKQMATRNRITVDSLVEELDEARGLALRVDQPSAAISATISKARLVGLMVERKEHGTPGEFADLQSEEKVLAMVRAELGDEQANALRAALARSEAQPEQLDEQLDVVPTHGVDGTRN